MKKSYLMLLLVAMFTLVACDKAVPLSEEELYINNLIAQCQNFDSETLIQGIPGEWKRDSYIMYSDEWKKDFEILQLKGDSGASAGLGSEFLTFTAEGTGQLRTINYSLGTDCVKIFNFEWIYDADYKKLVMSGEYNAEFDVKGYNGEYIILDYYDKANKKYAREIYKRVTEN